MILQNKLLICVKIYWQKESGNLRWVKIWRKYVKMFWLILKRPLMDWRMWKKSNLVYIKRQFRKGFLLHSFRCNEQKEVSAATDSFRNFIRAELMDTENRLRLGGLGGVPEFDVWKTRLETASSINDFVCLLFRIIYF